MAEEVNMGSAAAQRVAQWKVAVLLPPVPLASVQLVKPDSMARQETLLLFNPAVSH